MAVLIGFHRDGSIRERPFCRSVETYPEFVARSLELLASHRIDTILFGELGFLANIREVEGGGKKRGKLEERFLGTKCDERIRVMWLWRGYGEILN